jgi:hypothetical protein
LGQDIAMTAVRYPVAANAEAALSAPVGRASRLTEAETLAGGPVAFVSEAAGPAFKSREALLEAYAGRLDDERSGAGVAPEDRYLNTVELAVKADAAKPVRPIYRGGRRWPKPSEPPATLWRLSVRYWRIGEGAAPALSPPAPPAAGGRRGKAPPPDAPPLDAKALRERIQQPLRPVKPQQPLDTGLFEVRPPEAPHIVMPDE